MNPMFVVPEDLIATAPAEYRGRGRDDVRLMVASPAGVRHLRFDAIVDVLHAGDLLVVNTSATLPAAVDGIRADGRSVVVDFGGVLETGRWIVELRRPDGGGPLLDARAGERIALHDGASITLTGPHGESRGRLWEADVALPPGGVEPWLREHGRPITYGHVARRWPLEAYQSVFARVPGSAEMPSAARPFTPRLVLDLVARGVTVAPVLLHAGVSSTEAGEAPPAERFEVPQATAALVNSALGAGRRIVAAGTTVVRALETVAGDDGRVSPGRGWTTLVLSPDRPARAVDTLLTGWHDPNSSHLLLLEAVAGATVVRQAYAAALDQGYRWHEFGDSGLLSRRPL
ncbi:MAG: S-adenosylmethionine:tRNA ribosyltransferase-isomerase [Candidatus Dormibacteraeota bacterium]|nr:S-adenosylmethionine:tRNA ribosyltransferase-isomerase [Candidatus Dormibacteraeota bacterium]MBV9526620.1 S-adenosylmethionine:tRNA ribosyltransferase-isomerase [Candidatus Dormibacteraeota bacterium]